VSRAHRGRTYRQEQRRHSRRGEPVSFHIRPLKTPKDCALAYADLLDDVGAGRLTLDEA